MHQNFTSATSSSIPVSYWTETVGANNNTTSNVMAFIINRNIANKSFNSGFENYGSTQGWQNATWDSNGVLLTLSLWTKSIYSEALETLTRVSPVDYTLYIWIGTVSGVAIAAIIIVLYVRHGKTKKGPTRNPTT